MNTSQYTDKQIMDLSSSPSTGNNKIDFLDLVNPHQDFSVSNAKKEEIVPSYEFHPIRPVGSSSSPPALSNADSSNVGGARDWNSVDSKINTASVRNYGSLESMEPTKGILEKDGSRFDSLVSEIDQTMKKYTDNLLHALDGVSARISQLETRTRQIENSVDDLKLSVGNTFGGTDGKLRQLENILREVHTEVQVIRDKQEIVEAKLHVAKHQSSKVEQQADTHNTLPIDSFQGTASAPQHSHQQQSFPAAIAQPPPTLPPLDAPPQSPQQIHPSQVQLPNQFSSNQISSIPPRESYIPAPEIPTQQYQMPLPQQLHQPSPPAPPPQQQYQPVPQPQYSQPPLPPQSHPSIPPINLSQPPQPQPPLGHHTEESQFPQHHIYPPNIHKPSGALSQQFYGTAPNTYELPSSRPGPYGPSSGHGEPYPHSSSFSSQYGSGSPRKSQQIPPTMNQSGGSGYPQLPTARILPQALPTASAVGGNASSVGSGNRVPIDDVVDKVTHMGFPREQVKETVRKLTDNGQAVDLNVVLDKLMNDGAVQPPRGWFNR